MSPVQLYHVGEPLIAAMLNRLAEMDQLNRVICARKGISLADDLKNSGIEPPFKFIPDEANLRIQIDSRTLECDGFQRLDVLCAGSNNWGLAFEAKLGITLMSASTFDTRFCSPCTVSRHAIPQLRGQMPALLDRKIHPPGETTLTATIAHKSWTLAPNWWLVLRRQVLQRWPIDNLPLHDARIIAFETLAALYGAPDKFDELVHEIVGGDFAHRWQIDFEKGTVSNT